MAAITALSLLGYEATCLAPLHLGTFSHSSLQILSSSVRLDGERHCTAIFRYLQRMLLCFRIRSIDTLYHGTLRFILNCTTLTHHCTLYTRVGCPSLVTRRLSHWYTFIYKAILGLLPFYFGHFLVQKCGGYSLRSLDFILLTVPNVRTEFGKRAFMYSAPSSWNALQNTFKLEEFVQIGIF